MTDGKKKLRPRRRSVRLGGTSQSAFAGYAPQPRQPKQKSEPNENSGKDKPEKDDK